MKKTRVYQIAEEVGMSNKDILAKIKELGIEVENEKSELEEDDVELILDLIKEENSGDSNTITVEGALTVQQLAESLGKPATEVIMKLMKMGTMASLNQEVSFEVASQVASEYGFTLEVGGQEENSEEEIEALKTIGFDSEFISKNELPFKALAAIKFKNQAQFNIMKYLIGLANCIENNNGKIFEKTKVYDLKKSDSDEYMMDSLFNIIESYIDSNNFEQAKKYSKLALAAAIKTKSKYDEFRALKYYCDIYKYKGETEISIEYLLKCIDIVSALDKEEVLGNLYIELGQLYSGISKDKELECYQKGVTIFKNLEII